MRRALAQSWNKEPSTLKVGEGLTFKNESLVRRVLRVLVSPKEWAQVLGVTPQQVTSWKNGEAIPKARHLQIVTNAKEILMAQAELEKEIDRTLLALYGPAARGEVDPAVFDEVLKRGFK